LQGAIGRSRARVAPPATIDRPDSGVHLGTGEAGACEEAGGLVRQRQHTAGGIARADPIHGARSDASPAVEDHQQPRAAEQFIQAHRFTGQRGLNRKGAEDAKGTGKNMIAPPSS
jgi:hypothetical protein